MTIHRLPCPDCVDDHCAACHAELAYDGSCPTCGNVAQAVAERLAERALERDAERSDS